MSLKKCNREWGKVIHELRFYTRVTALKHVATNNKRHMKHSLFTPTISQTCTNKVLLKNITGRVWI